MKIFNSEVHDTAIVFICLNIIPCCLFSLITGGQIGLKEGLVFVWFAAVLTTMYWFVNYSADHFKNNDNENEN